MQLLELALQGVRGFSPDVRVQLKTGYWVLAPAGQGTPPLGGLLQALFFSDGRGGDAAFAAPGAKESSAGVMLQGNDHATYWLVRNLGQSGALHRYVPTSQSFEPVSQEATEIGQFVRGQVGVPAKAALEGLFTFTLAQLPTHRPKVKAAAPAAAAPAKPVLASARPVEAVEDVGAAKAKLADLEKERGLAEEVEKIQYQVDGLASRVFALESKLKETQTLREQVEEARAAVQAAPTPESLGLPPDILSRVDRYPQLVAKRDEAISKLEADRETAENPQVYTGEKLTQDARFWAGIAAGALFLGGGAFASGMVRYVALLDIPAFGASALLALRHLDAREQFERGSRRGSRLAEREQKILDQFESEAAIVKSAMKKLNVDAPSGITEALAQRPMLHERAEGLRRQLAAAESAPEYVQARDELAGLKQQQGDLDAQLTEKGSYVRDAREIEREIARLKEGIALSAAPKVEAPVPAPKAVAETAETLPDPGPPLLSLAADLLATDLPSAANLIKDRAVQYASALTDRRVTGLETDVFGKVSAVTAQGKVSLGELAGSDLNAVYLSLRFSLLERYCMKFRAPVIVEDVGAGLDPQQLALLGRMLKGLGKLTQVLHVTTRPEFVGAADGQVQV